jgi:hypothetical protein
MSTHTERAARMGYGGPVASKPKAEAPKVTSIYNNPYDVPLANYYDRREAKLRADAEGLETARRERKQVEDFARARGVSPEHLHEALSVMHERDEYPLKKENVEQRRTRTIENLRLELGGTEQANAQLQRYVSVTAALAKEVPTLAARANATGAGEDPRIIKALAHYGEVPTSTT